MILPPSTGGAIERPEPRRGLSRGQQRADPAQVVHALDSVPGLVFLRHCDRHQAHERSDDDEADYTADDKQHQEYLIPGRLLPRRSLVVVVAQPVLVAHPISGGNSSAILFTAPDLRG